jgi:AcrR family transcriptional regulator
MTPFQRARSEEQREVRRRAILDAAAAMLAEMPVAQVSLNELSRRVGLAKSNVLRYFESREAVLLELLDSAWQEWLGRLKENLRRRSRRSHSRSRRATGRTRRPAGGRTRNVTCVTPVLCDLISAQAAVLEPNVPPQVAAGYKRAALANVAR